MPLEHGTVLECLHLMGLGISGWQRPESGTVRVCLVPVTGLGVTWETHSWARLLGCPPTLTLTEDTSWILSFVGNILPWVGSEVGSNAS